MELKENEVIDDLEFKDLRIIQNKKWFKYGIDSVLLSDFAKIKKNAKVLDIGTGTGIISILLSKKTDCKELIGIEVQSDVADMAQRSVELNHLENKVKIINDNILNIEKYFPKEYFDSIVTNPPYQKNNSGLKNENEKQLVARHEVLCSLEDIIQKSFQMLRDNGNFYMVHRPERLVDILFLMRKYRLEPKEIRFVHSKAKEKPVLVLIKGVKYSGKFLKVLEPLIVYEDTGEYTDEIYKIYNKEKKWNGKLYLVATPIGNLEDITYRALKVLNEVDLIAAEDTRHTLGLLNHFEINKPLISYYKQTEKKKSPILIEKLLQGNNIAIVSDAGTPGISDPGEEIIKDAIQNDIEIIPIPGCVAFVNALIGSGLNTHEFIFLGFLSASNKERKDKLEEIKFEKRTLIFYEAPHKLKITLEAMLEVLGDRKIVLAKELTKIHEQYIRGNISTVLEQIGDNIKGEFVVLVEGAEKTKQELEIGSLNERSLEEHYDFYLHQGLDKKEIIKKISKDRNLNKNEIYQYFINK